MASAVWVWPLEAGRYVLDELAEFEFDDARDNKEAAVAAEGDSGSVEMDPVWLPRVEVDDGELVTTRVERYGCAR